MTRSYAAPRTDLDPADPLFAVFEDVYHWQTPDAQARMVADYRKRGWTDEKTTVTEVLTDWAVEHGLGVAVDRGVTATRSTVWVRIATCWSDLTVGRGPMKPGLGMDDVEARAWLRAAVGAPDDRAHLRLRELIGGLRHSDQAVMASWRRWLGPMAPLACAAGLTLSEAQRMNKAGVLDSDALGMLAGLRGWLLPPSGSTDW